MKRGNKHACRVIVWFSLIIISQLILSVSYKDKQKEPTGTLTKLD